MIDLLGVLIIEAVKDLLVVCSGGFLIPWT